MDNGSLEGLCVMEYSEANGKKYFAKLFLQEKERLRLIIYRLTVTFLDGRDVIYVMNELKIKTLH